jgi:hypothetical protein
VFAEIASGSGEEVSVSDFRLRMLCGSPLDDKGNWIWDGEFSLDGCITGEAVAPTAISPSPLGAIASSDGKADD